MFNRNLPPELWAQIISNIVPSDTKTVAFPASHPITRALHSCLFVCKSTVSVAQNELHRHCLYLDAAWRIRALLYSLRLGTPAFDHGIGLRRRWKIAASTSMYLAPFSHSGAKPACDEYPNLHVAADVEKLFSLLSSHLIRLVYDMPHTLIDAVTNDDYVGSLERALLNLRTLEEFTSLQPNMLIRCYITGGHLDRIEQLIWAGWMNLRKLSLISNPTIFIFSSDIGFLPHLEKLVFTNTHDDRRRGHDHALAQPHGTTGHAQPPMPHASYTLVRSKHSDQSPFSMEAGALKGAHSATEVTQIPSRIRRVIMGDSCHDSVITVLSSDSEETQGYTGTYVCQEWVRKAALDGCLWD